MDKSPITEEDRRHSSHPSTPSPENRFKTIGRIWRALRIKAPKAVKANPPIEIHLVESGPRILLEDLVIITGEGLDGVGVSTFELVYTVLENGDTCLTFTVNAVPGEIGSRFSQVNLHVRLVDPGSGDIIQIHKCEGVSATPVPPGEVTAAVSEDMQIRVKLSGAPEANMLKSISHNYVIKSSSEIDRWMWEQEGVVTLAMSEKVGIGNGVNGKHSMRLETTKQIPLDAEISVFGVYYGRQFEVPGRGGHLHYRLRLARNQELSSTVTKDAAGCSTSVP